MDKNMQKIMEFLFPFLPKSKIISPENVRKCCLCGFWTKEPIQLHMTSMGKRWVELYCQHCYEIEKYDIPTPCRGGCKRCEAIK